MTALQACHESCSCGKDHAKNRWQKMNIIIVLIVSLTAFLLPLNYYLEAVLYTVCYLLIGGPVIKLAARNILRGHIFDENLLMTIATIGAIAIGSFSEAVAVMLFYQAGQYLEDRAVNRSRRSVRALLEIKPDYANLIKNGEVMRVEPDMVKIGDIVLVKPGERVPLDGSIVSGESVIDTSALTGESLPRFVKCGDKVLSGSVNMNGLIHLKVEEEYLNSTVTRILDLVENASSRKAGSERFITSFAKYYTPLVVVAAILLALLGPLLTQASFADWFYRALVFLVISCPCALVISIPLSYVGGIGAAARRGILIKGGSYLDALNRVKTMVFDKTGTLTRGELRVKQVLPRKGFNAHEVLEYAAWAENCSLHPLARAVQQAYGRAIPVSSVDTFEEQPGYGVKAVVSGKTIMAGSVEWLEQAGIKTLCPEHAGTAIHLAVDNEYAGCILFSDELKDDSARTLRSLRKLGVDNLVVLTGDKEEVVAKLASDLELDGYQAGLLPQEKLEALERILRDQKSGSLVFVGDGINDAPVLARADVGVAMGAMGSAAAVEAADAVLMTDEPAKLLDAIKIARKTRIIVWQNIVLALSLKGIILLLGAWGLASMWSAIFADVGVALLAILNSLRTLRVPA